MPEKKDLIENQGGIGLKFKTVATLLVQGCLLKCIFECNSFKYDQTDNMTQSQ